MMRSSCGRIDVSMAVTLVSLLAGVATAAETLYLEQKVSASGVMGQPGTSSTNKLWMSDTVLRTEDEVSGVVTILRSDTGKVFVIQTESKTYSELTIEQMKGMAQMGLAMLGKQGSKPLAKLVETDETREVAGHKCRKVLVKIEGGALPMEMTMWLTKDLDVDMSSWMKLAGTMGMQGLVGDALEKIAALEGYPLLQETKMKLMGMEMTTTQETLLVENRPTDPSLFEVPEGFTKTEGLLPGMPQK